MTLLQDPDQVQADPSPLRVHIQDPNLHPFPRSQGEATAALADRQFVQGDAALVDEARAANTDIYKSPKQSCVVHPARQHRTHPQITHRHNAPLKVRLPKIWGWQKRENIKKMRWLDGSQVRVAAWEEGNGKRECRKVRGVAEMTNRYYISSSNPILMSAYFHISQYSILSHFPLGLFMRDLFPFCSINTNKEGSRPRK